MSFVLIAGRWFEVARKTVVVLWLCTGISAAADKPNILWIVAEDASPHIGCYGETAKASRYEFTRRYGNRLAELVKSSRIASPSRQ